MNSASTPVVVYELQTIDFRVGRIFIPTSSSYLYGAYLGGMMPSSVYSSLGMAYSSMSSLEVFMDAYSSTSSSYIVGPGYSVY